MKADRNRHTRLGSSGWQPPTAGAGKAGCLEGDRTEAGPGATLRVGRHASPMGGQRTRGGHALPPESSDRGGF